MKARFGFVSNSSSCSFLIYGIRIDQDKLSEILKDEFKQGLEEAIEDDNLYDFLEKIFPDFNVEQPDYYDDEFYIGKSWSSIKDDETGKVFKDNICSKLSEAFKTDINCGTYQEAWEDR